MQRVCEGACDALPGRSRLEVRAGAGRRRRRRLEIWIVAPLGVGSEEPRLAVHATDRGLQPKTAARSAFTCATKAHSRPILPLSGGLHRIEMCFVLALHRIYVFISERVKQMTTE